MSHVDQMTTKIRDLAVAREMFKRLGWELLEGQKTYTWYGRHMKDYPIPEGMTVADLGTCDHAVRVPGCRYELGLRRAADGSYAVVYDFWGSGGLDKHKRTIRRLPQLYAAECGRFDLQRQGFRNVDVREEENGELYLAFERQGGAS